MAAAAAAGKSVLVTKPLGRSADEARGILQIVEDAGVFGGYLEDLCYTPKTRRRSPAPGPERSGTCSGCAAARRIPGRTARGSGTAEEAGGGAIVDLGCHCIEIIRSFMGKGNRPVEVMCWADTLVHPIEAEDHAVALVRFESGAMGQFEVSWAFRGGMDLRDEVAGTEGTIWLNHFLRTGFEMFSTGGTGRTSRRRPRPTAVGCSPSATRSRNWGTPTCSPTCSTRWRPEPQPTRDAV